MDIHKEIEEIKERLDKIEERVFSAASNDEMQQAVTNGVKKAVDYFIKKHNEEVEKTGKSKLKV